MKTIFSLMTFLMLIFFSQAGNVGFRKFPLMDKKKGDAGGGTGTKDKDEDEDDSQDDEDEDESEDEDDEDDDSGNQNDINSLPEWAQKHIKDLRKESAKNRNNLKTAREQLEKKKKPKSKSEDSQEEDEEEDFQVDSQAYQIQVENEILNVALENGVPKEQVKFFKFLVLDRLNSLEEGEELDEDDIAEIIKELPAGKGSKGPANSSFGGNGSKGKSPAGAKAEVTKEEFSKMGIIARSKLYQKNPELYNKLLKEVGI